MSIVILSLVLLAGVAYVAWDVLGYASDWGGLHRYAIFLYVGAPVGSLTLAAMLWAQWMHGWPWLFSAGIFTLAAALQLAMLVAWGFNQWTYCLLPALVICASAVGLARGGAPLPVRPWMRHGGAALIAAALPVFAGGYGLRVREERRLRADSESYAADEAQRTATLRGIERAVWLIERASWQIELEDAGFARSGLYREPRTGVEYRWDEARRRLVVRWPVLGEASEWRPALIKMPERALESQALRPGPRSALGGGVLECAPPLECSLTWEVDVDKLTPNDNFRAELQGWVSALELEVMRELIPER